jgi:hypothetical protein
VGLDAAAVQLDQPAHERQADAEAAARAVAAARTLVVPLEHARQFVRRHADAVVGDADAEGAGLALDGNADRAAAGREH